MISFKWFKRLVCRTSRITWKNEYKIWTSEILYEVEDYANGVINWLIANGKPIQADSMARVVYIKANEQIYKVWLGNFPYGDLGHVIDLDAQNKSDFDQYDPKIQASIVMNSRFIDQFGIVYTDMSPKKKTKIRFYEWLNEYNIPIHGYNGMSVGYLKKY